jgi:hypothetical protein
VVRPRHGRGLRYAAWLRADRLDGAAWLRRAAGLGAAARLGRGRAWWRRLRCGCPRRDVQRGGSVRLGGDWAALLGHRMVSLSRYARLFVFRGIPVPPREALKNPSCRVAVEGRAQELDWSALCAPAKYENVVPLHGYHPHPQAGLSSNYHGQHLSMRDGRVVRPMAKTAILSAHNPAISPGGTTPRTPPTCARGQNGRLIGRTTQAISPGGTPPVPPDVRRGAPHRCLTRLAM